MAQGSAPPDQIAQFRSDGFSASTGLRVPLSTDIFTRLVGTPDARVVNMMVEATPLREESAYRAPVGLREMHYARPALVPYAAPGSGPIRGLFSQSGVFSGSQFSVSGGLAYINAVAAGSIGGSDIVQFAASASQVVAVAGGVAYLVSLGGSSFSPIVSSVLPPVSDVAYVGNRFIYVCQGSDTFFYSDLNNAASIDGLSFETAESYPDATVAVGVLNEEAVFFGGSSVEFFSQSTDPAAPFTPVRGRGFQRGCVSRDSVVFADNALFWVGDNLVVYRVGSDAPLRVSDSSIEAKIKTCATPSKITAWAATFEGHELYVLNVPGVGSYAYDTSRVGTHSAEVGEWAEWQSFGRPQFRGQVATSLAGVTYVGDDTTNNIWSLQKGVYTDGTDPLTRIASAWIKVEEGTPRCNNIVLHGAMGVGNAVNPGASPIVEMRFSDDMGHTFTDWRAGQLGGLGAYRTRAYWTRLGAMRAPGRLVELRCSDPVLTTWSHLELNALRPAM